MILRNDTCIKHLKICKIRNERLTQLKRSYSRSTQERNGAALFTAVQVVLYGLEQVHSAEVRVWEHLGIDALAQFVAFRVFKTGLKLLVA